MITQAQINAALRHVYTATGFVVATLAAVGIAQGDATAIGTAVHQIGDGIASIAMGVGTLAGIASAAYAAWSASRASQVAAVAAMPGTVVSPKGTTITLVEPQLREVAKEAATPAGPIK